MRGRRPWLQNLGERTSWGGWIGFEDVGARSVGWFEGLGSSEANGVREKELHIDLNTRLQRLPGRHTLTLTRLWAQSTKRKSFLRHCDSHFPPPKIARIGHDREHGNGWQLPVHCRLQLRALLMSIGRRGCSRLISSASVSSLPCLGTNRQMNISQIHSLRPVRHR